jgi:hypothetical protein
MKSRQLEVVNGEDHYYAHWKGYPAEDDSREPKSNLSPETWQHGKDYPQRKAINKKMEFMCEAGMNMDKS